MREARYAVTVIKKWQHNSRMLFANLFYSTLKASDNDFTPGHYKSLVRQRKVHIGIFATSA